MGWEVVKREDSFAGSNRPFISISKDHLAFNALFSRISELTSNHRVTLYANPQTFCLGFEFHKDDRPNSLALSHASAAKKGEKRAGFFCAVVGLIRRYPWVEAITKLDSKDRRFYDPRREGSKWVIQLCPAFEVRRARESESISSEAQGIYRYVREDGEVVYIGRGNIKKRLASPGREDWDFDVIEYSIVDDPDQQVYWEGYWLERFKEATRKLPIYNKLLGSTRPKKRAEDW